MACGDTGLAPRTTIEVDFERILLSGVRWRGRKKFSVVAGSNSDILLVAIEVIGKRLDGCAQLLGLTLFTKQLLEQCLRLMPSWDRRSWIRQSTRFAIGGIIDCLHRAHIVFLH